MNNRVYPYIPNSEPNVQKEMLDYLGLSSLDDFMPMCRKGSSTRNGWICRKPLIRMGDPEDRRRDPEQKPVHG